MTTGWAQNEIDTLRREIRRLKYHEIASILGRSPCAVRKRAQMLGLTVQRFQVAQPDDGLPPDAPEIGEADRRVACDAHLRDLYAAGFDVGHGEMTMRASKGGPLRVSVAPASVRSSYGSTSAMCAEA